jgi:hypothetical protein
VATAPLIAVSMTTEYAAGRLFSKNLVASHCVENPSVALE